MGMASNEYFKKEKVIYFHFIHLEVENCCCSKRIIKTRQTRSAACLLACLPVHQPGCAHQCNSKNNDNTQGRLLSSAVCVPIPKTKNSKMTNDNNKMLDMSLRVIYSCLMAVDQSASFFFFVFFLKPNMTSSSDSCLWISTISKTKWRKTFERKN